MSAALAFLACVERGRLEVETLLLCRSIRRFAGRLRDAPIHAFNPRAGAEIHAETREALEAIGVTLHDEPLNRELPAYGAGNKVFVAAWAEAHLDEEILVFLDSDTVVIAEPGALVLPPAIPAAVRVADSLPLNSTGADHPMEAYWQGVTDHLGDGLSLDALPWVVTELGRRVRPYFSAGLIAARREAGLFAHWREVLLDLVAAGLEPPGWGIARMDEVALVAAILPRIGDIRLLDGRYNYLIYRRERLAPPWRSARLEDLVHLHYRRCFADPGFLDRLEPPIAATGPIRAWLDSQLPLTSPRGE